MTTIDEAQATRPDDLGRLHETIIPVVAGVAQAGGEMRKALDTLARVLDDRRLEAAAAPGQTVIASAFVFLQHTLGGLQMAEYRKQASVPDIAGEVRSSGSVASVDRVRERASWKRAYAAVSLSPNRLRTDRIPSETPSSQPWK